MSQSKVLADRIYPAEGLAADVVRIAAANILLVLCAHIAFPLPWTPVPVTGQTFGVLLVALLLGSRRGALVLGLYLLEGLAGLPVFQPLGLPGPARFLGPTAGYLLAYPPAAFVAGWFAERGISGVRNHFESLRADSMRLFSALISGEVIIFTGGCAWLALVTGVGWTNSFRIGALPFLPGEILKMALIVAAVGGLEFARPKNSI
ncbi:MAG TPA: biotin transporter BioY [Candidatus Acidoferrales bacterium]|nr:biotin transporter BioY [Candidatus Acidoferrales bacterium]